MDKVLSGSALMPAPVEYNFILLWLSFLSGNWSSKAVQTWHARQRKKRRLHFISGNGKRVGILSGMLACASGCVHLHTSVYVCVSQRACVGVGVGMLLMLIIACPSCRERVHFLSRQWKELQKKALNVGWIKFFCVCVSWRHTDSQIRAFWIRPRVETIDLQDTFHYTSLNQLKC